MREGYNDNEYKFYNINIYIQIRNGEIVNYPLPPVLSKFQILAVKSSEQLANYNIGLVKEKKKKE